MPSRTGKVRLRPRPSRSRMIDDAKTLLVVPEAGEGFGQGRLTGVAEGGVTEIVAETDGLDEVLVEEERRGRWCGRSGSPRGCG